MTVYAKHRTDQTSQDYDVWSVRTGDATFSGIASSSLPGWSADRLVDNNLTTQWSSYGHTEHLSSSEWAAVLLQQRTDIQQIRLYPRYNAAQQADGFPKTSCCSTRTTATAANAS
ncbi:MAG: discoidin domain-containing protein [Caldilineaceae bacterium]